jgi:hypothetical protein
VHVINGTTKHDFKADTLYQGIIGQRGGQLATNVGDSANIDLLCPLLLLWCRGS